MHARDSNFCRGFSYSTATLYDWCTLAPESLVFFPVDDSVHDMAQNVPFSLEFLPSWAMWPNLSHLWHFGSFEPTRRAKHVLSNALFNYLETAADSASLIWTYLVLVFVRTGYDSIRTPVFVQTIWSFERWFVYWSSTGYCFFVLFRSALKCRFFDSLKEHRTITPN